MRTASAAAFVLLGFMVGGNAMAETMFDYRGNVLMPATGSGVPGARRLRFQLVGAMPKAGACRSDLAITFLSDGGYSYQDALRSGFMASADSKVQVCRDAATGKLLESLYVNMVLFRNGNLQASYAWQSFDPVQSRMADTVTSYQNIEYHVSSTKRAGHLWLEQQPRAIE